MSSYGGAKVSHGPSDRAALRIPTATRDRHGSTTDRAATPFGGRRPMAGPALGVNHILALQRSIGNKAVAQLLAVPLGEDAMSPPPMTSVQRDKYKDWKKAAEKKPTKGVVRDPRLGGVDFSVDKYLAASKSKDLGGQLYWLCQLKVNLAEVSAHGLGEATSKRTALAKSVASQIVKTEKAIDKDKTLTLEDKKKFRAYITMGGDSGLYARRDLEGKSIGKGIPGGWLGGLSEDRDAQGDLTDEAVQGIEDAKTKELEELKTKFESAGIVGDVTRKQAKKAIEDTKVDSITKTTFESNQYEKGADLSNDPADEEIKAVSVAGTTVNIHYNKTDPNFGVRKAALKSALTLIQGKMAVPIPAFDAYMPKFSWKVENTGSKGNIQIHVTEIGNRAEFYLPNTILLTMGAMDAKVTNSVSATVYNAAQQKGEYAANRGIATTVHELGHLIHYKLAPKSFLNLQMSVLRGEISTGAPRKQHVTQAVSGYGATNPRETVAEIFTGIVFGKAYDKDLMDIYKSFGGPAMG